MTYIQTIPTVHEVLLLVFRPPKNEEWRQLDEREQSLGIEFEAIENAVWTPVEQTYDHEKIRSACERAESIMGTVTERFASEHEMTHEEMQNLLDRYFREKLAGSYVDIRLDFLPHFD